MTGQTLAPLPLASNPVNSLNMALFQPYGSESRAEICMNLGYFCLPFPTGRLASRNNGTLNHKFTSLAGKTPFPSSESWWPGNRSKYFNICSSSLERLKPVLLPVHQEEASLGGFKDSSPGSRSPEPLLSQHLPRAGHLPICKASPAPSLVCFSRS